MEQGASKLENDYWYWRKREQRQININGSEVLSNPRFLKEKLAYLEVLELKHKNPMSLDDRLTMAIIKDKRRELERDLYPGLLTRMLYRSVKAVLSRRMEAKYKQADQGKLDDLGERMTIRGFGNLKPQIEKQVSQGLDEFSIPFTKHFSEKERVDYKLDFRRDNNGNVELAECRARLKNGDGPPTGFISLTKNSLELVDVNQAYNLLSGRSVCINDHWLQLDFTDKDAAGNYKTKVFDASYGFDLEKNMSDLKIKEAKNPEQNVKMLQELKNGDLVQVTKVGRMDKIEISANAQRKMVIEASNNLSEIKQSTHRAKIIPFKAAKKEQKTKKTMKINR